MLQRDVLIVAFFPPPMPEKSSGLLGSLEEDRLHSRTPEKSSGPGMRPFTFLNAGKFWSLEPGKVLLHGLDFYGKEECKCLIPGTGRLFWHSGKQ
jgi:hypothetical protein